MKKIIISIILAMSMISGITASAMIPEYAEEYKTQPSYNYSQKFSDVPKSHWAYDYIMEMVNRGVLSGYPNGRFYPNNSITRAEFSKIMCVSAGLDVNSVKNTSYVDVKSSDWFAPFIEAGKYYLSGYISNGERWYKPNANALREDIAVALVKLKGYDVSIYDESILYTMFKDKDSISSGARKYVAVAVENGLISGYEDDTFRGQNTVTRAEAATLLWRAYQYGDENKVFDTEDMSPDYSFEKETVEIQPEYDNEDKEIDEDYEYIEEPDPEYSYEMDTLMKNIRVAHMIGTDDSLIFTKKIGDELGRSNEVYEIKDGKITKILDSKDINYLGDTEDGYATSSYIKSLGFNSYDNCPYAIICQTVISEGDLFYIYNLYTGEYEYYCNTDTGFAGVHGRTETEFTVDINGEIIFSYDIAHDEYHCMSVSIIDDIVIDGASTIYVDQRTGCRKSSDRVSYSGELFNANNLHRYSIDDNAIYRYDLDWNEEKLLTFDDIDNVDNRRIDFKQIKYPHHFSNAIDNEGTIYFWDEKYESIRCIRKK